MIVPAPDPKSVTGKPLAIAETVDVLVVGAGPAGLAAAIGAAARGFGVLLVDENPVPFGTMGDEVPLHYGQGMAASARNRNAMMEAFVASEPRIAEAFRAGVDLRLGTACWGLYANGPALGWMPGLVAGLADAERSILVQARHVVLACGRRDMGLGFPGWEKPGVLGATAALSLTTRYGAFGPRRIVILGSTTEALATALALREAGVAIAAIVEQASEPVGDADLLAELRAGGTEISPAVSCARPLAATASRRHRLRCWTPGAARWARSAPLPATASCSPSVRRRSSTCSTRPAARSPSSPGAAATPRARCRPAHQHRERACRR